MQQDFSLQAYNYTLPAENIAQHPADARENSRLLMVNCSSRQQKHGNFHDIIELFQAGDLLVVNNTKVFPARLHGHKESGGKVEVFLLAYPIEKTSSDNTVKTAEVTCLIKSSKRPKVDSTLQLGPDLQARILTLFPNGKVQVELQYRASQDLAAILATHGQVPLPPYISRETGSTEEDRERYQTVYAKEPGAVAAPTAGLHFSEKLLEKIHNKGVKSTQITLHVGHGTFAPVRCEDIREHQIHEEYISVSQESANTINAVRKNGGKIWAVGTTTVRTIEFMTDANGNVQAGNGWCNLYILPGYTFKTVDNLITNFHLPKSSLLFLVSALYGREELMNVYQSAITAGYRFYSYGDAMVIHG